MGRDTDHLAALGDEFDPTEQRLSGCSALVVTSRRARGQHLKPAKDVRREGAVGASSSRDWHSERPSLLRKAKSRPASPGALSIVARLHGKYAINGQPTVNTSIRGLKIRSTSRLMRTRWE